MSLKRQLQLVATREDLIKKQSKFVNWPASQSGSEVDRIRCAVRDRLGRVIRKLDRRILVVVPLVVMVGCTTKMNVRYCDKATPCTVQGMMTCDFVKHECELDSDMAMAMETPDMETNDLALERDLQELPDLETPDLIPPPDLTPLPDLTPPTPYFIPDVEAVLDAHTCARNGCHNAVTPGLYSPLLIPDPMSSVAQHQNFTNFSAETQVVMFQKLVNNNGTAHGGVMKNDPDRKPCATDQDEPCATLSRWYIAGMPEHN